MFQKIAKFFIENSKLTFVLVSSTFIVWIFSYMIIPKQYNPEIIVPAFNITIQANSLTSTEVHKYITSPLENKIMELEWIDEVYGISWENYGWVMAKFHVWIDKEKAKIRLIQKLNENMEQNPIWASQPNIQTIDPDELPQITFAISYDEQNNTSKLNEEEKYILLRQTANIIKEEIKTVKNVTTIDIVWGYKKNIIINLNTKKLESKNLNILQVLWNIKSNNISSPVWDINLESWEKILLNVDWKTETIEEVENIIVWNLNNEKIYLKEIAEVKYGVKRIDKVSMFTERLSEKQNLNPWIPFSSRRKEATDIISSQEEIIINSETEKMQPSSPIRRGDSGVISSSQTVFIWFWKKIGSNSIFVTNDIKEKVEEIQKTLPENIKITIIQDEWQTAKDATNMLLINLVQSIAIVVFILTLSLWLRNALNTAISIPLTLSSVFAISLLIWESINRITLFALILVLWMLVDDSTVVVENISRHLETRKKEWKTKLEAILEAIKEVELWVVLSTVTRLLAFWAMFAVWAMMWEYMWPIPKFALMASVISTAVALTINPWISYHFTKEKNSSLEFSSPQGEEGLQTVPLSHWGERIQDRGQIKKDKTKKIRNKNRQHRVLALWKIFSKLNKFNIRKIYLKFLGKFLWEEKWKKTRRKLFKLVFWISLFIVVVWPIYLWIFKARMLPKSNQNQVYLWIDTPRWWNATKTKEVEEEITKFFFSNILSTEGFNPLIVKNISSTIWQASMWDFANLFRWWGYRIWENQISSRINLYSPEEYEEITWKTRINSEKFVIDTRPHLRKYLLEKFPDIKIKLLEDPPWPPVRSTFRAKIKWDASEENLYLFVNKVKTLVESIAPKEELVDIVDNLPTSYKKINLKIDKHSLVSAWLTTKQIVDSLAIITSWLDISPIKNKDSLEITNIVLSSKDNNTTSLVDELTITNSKWERIPLSSVVKKEITFVGWEIETDNREKNFVISAEMWNNSLVYPQIRLFKELMSDKFLWNEFKMKFWSPYRIDLTWLKDGKTYSIEWWWEWKLTIDTFRDLWIAMAISLLAIYLMLVWQFRSFWVARIIMITFLLGFFWVFWIFSLLYLIKNEYFSATSMIWVIALGWIVVWNAILLIEYINILLGNWVLLKDAILKASYTRFKPIILTSLTTVFWAATIIWDPVWSGLAWAIIWGLGLSSILTLIVIPVFYYDSESGEG